jgi:hypothetical protein
MNLSKRTLILILVAIAGIIAAVFSAKHDSQAEDLEADEDYTNEDPEQDQEADQDPEQDQEADQDPEQETEPAPAASFSGSE